MQSVSRLNKTFSPTHYDLSLVLDRPGRTFSGTATINGEVFASGEVRLHAKDLAIETVTVDAHAANWHQEENDELVIATDSIKPGTHVVVLRFSGTITDAMHGLYPCYFEHNGEKKELLATQFESHHAREVFPCIDEPEAKATFDVTLTTETGITVLGNMPISNQREENGKLVTSFATTPRMSSYLVAFVLGDLHRKTAQTKSGVEVNIWATPAQTPDSLDFALEHAVKSIEFFDEYFGVAYPLPKSDHVALPDFSSGAMENWGLITYREVALLADPATTTVASKQYIGTVISHELSHQWFGNLVTMKWWNDLWLNESFATLMEYIACDAIHPEWNSWLDFATNESILALRRDAIDGVQAVRVDVHHPDEISTLFDGAIVYAKGARLMRMCQDFIGSEHFRAGLESYFKEFAYKNTEADDLWRHLSASSGQDISAFMNTWLTQSGYPALSVYPDHIEQTQFFVGPHEKSDKLWPIPLGAESEEDVPRLLETRSLTLPIAETERFNIRDSAHFITHYQPEHLYRLLEQVTSFDELGRLQLLNEQTLLARGGVLPSDELIDMLDAYKNESAENVWTIMSVALGELRKFVETDEAAEMQLRALTGKIASVQYKRLGWTKRDDEPDSDIKLRSLILSLMIYAEDPDVIEYCEELFEQGIEAIDPEIRALVLSSVVKRTSDERIIRNLLTLYSTTPSADLRDDICAGLTSVKQPEHIKIVLGALTDKSTVRPQDIFRWFAYIIRNRYARIAAWQWLVDNWSWIDENFAGDKSYDDFPRYSAAGMMTRSDLDKYREFFTPLRNIPALTRNIELGIREIEGRVELIERDTKAVVAKLNLLSQ